MSFIKGVSKLAVAGARQLHATPRMSAQQCVKYGEMSPKLKAKQALFQAENDLPVHLKGGVGDVILYRLTMAGVMLGTTWSMWFLIKRSFET